MISSQGFDFVEGCFDADLGELLWPFLHIVEGKLISFEELEVIGSQIHDRAYLEISVHQITTFSLMFMPLSLKELSSPNSWIFISVLVDLNSVVSAEEWYNKLAVVFIFVLRNQTSFESQSILIVCEDLCHVLLGRFGLQTVDAPQWVFRSPITVERRNLMLYWFPLNLFFSCETKFNA